MRKFAEGVVKLKWPIIIAVTVLTAFFGYQFKDIKINADIISSLPDDDPVALLYKNIGEEFGGNELGMIVLETNDIFQKEVLEHVKQITDTLKYTDGISTVTSLTDVIDIKGSDWGIEIGKLVDEYDMPDTQQELDSLKQRVFSKEMYKGSIVSEDGTSTLIMFTMLDDIDKQKLAIEIKEKIIGLDLPDKGMVQVSLNLTHPKRTKIHQVLEVVRNEARRFGATVVETEIVGMVPLFALLDALKYYLQPEKLDESMILDLHYLGGAEGPKEKTFSEMTLIEFGDQVRRARATPGGGSVAAALGSYGSALVCMVTGLSLSGRKFAAIKEEMLKVRHAVENDRGVLMGLVEEDSVAFDEVMNTFKMPEDTPAEKKQKEKAVQATTKGAAEVPLQTMRHSFKALEGAKIAAEKGNINTITDAGMAALALLAAIEGAALNVKVNLGNITDKDFAKKMGDEVEDLLTKGRALKEEIMVIVEDRMKQLAESS